VLIEYLYCTINYYQVVKIKVFFLFFLWMHKERTKESAPRPKSRFRLPPATRAGLRSPATVSARLRAGRGQPTHVAFCGNRSLWLWERPQRFLDKRRMRRAAEGWGFTKRYCLNQTWRKSNNHFGLIYHGW